MWSSPIPVNLIRYLIVWKANRSLVWLPRCLSTELSLVLGTIIANRLATNEAAPWRKALTPLLVYYDQSLAKDRKEPTTIPHVSWPLETVLFAYPGKAAYGQGELILWELKLLGPSAEHSFFLEIILPAMEEAGYTSEPKWNRKNRLWGHFDIHAVYVARGQRWEPLVTDGRLDLRYRPTPNQWAESLDFGEGSKHKFTRLAWQTPFEFWGILDSESEINASANTEVRARPQGPGLQNIIEALVSRVGELMPGRDKSRREVMDILTAGQQAALRSALEQAGGISLRSHNLQPATKYWPGSWIGEQIFSPIPDSVIPFLELASILHIGRQTHFGCGTFVLA
jgi:hypothetical protein